MAAWTKVRDETDGFDLVNHPIPTPGEGEVLVKTKATSICGTDLHPHQDLPGARLGHGAVHQG